MVEQLPSFRVALGSILSTEKIDNHWLVNFLSPVIGESHCEYHSIVTKLDALTLTVASCTIKTSVNMKRMMSLPVSHVFCQKYNLVNIYLFCFVLVF